MTDIDNTKQVLQKLKQLEQENIRLREQLQHQRRARYAADSLSLHCPQFLQALDMVAYAVDLKSRPVSYQGTVSKITGYDTADLLNGTIKWEELVYPEDLPLFLNKDRALINNTPHITEYRIISGKGQIRWVSDVSIMVNDEQDRPWLIEGLVSDITRFKETEEAFLERQAQLDSILNSVQDVIWSVTPDTFELIYINPAAENLYGYSLEQIYNDMRGDYVLMQTSRDVLLDNFATLLERGWFEAEFCLPLPSGEKRWLHRRAHFARDAHGVIARIDGIDTDITRRKEAEDTLKYISLHDSLTGLFNRFFFEKEMQRLNNEAYVSVGLLVCDVDGLKIVNDKLGHDAGDQLLKHCAQVLTSCFDVHKQQVVSRIGGDEFAVLIENCSKEELAAAASCLRQAIVEHNNQSNLAFPISLSIGMALRDSATVKMEEVFRHADNMMYAEKPSSHQRFEKLFNELY